VHDAVHDPVARLLGNHLLLLSQQRTIPADSVRGVVAPARVLPLPPQQKVFVRRDSAAILHPPDHLWRHCGAPGRRVSRLHQEGRQRCE